MSERERANHLHSGDARGRGAEPASAPRRAAAVSERERANHLHSGDARGRGAE
jgi:hypothetical protein